MGKHFAKFAYALRTAVHDLTGKTQAELFLGRKLLEEWLLLKIRLMKEKGQILII